MPITPESLVQQNILCCLSGLVSTLASNYDAMVTHVDASGARSTNGGDLPDLCEQAAELATPIPDYEEAAREAGWQFNAETKMFWKIEGNHGVGRDHVANWQELCELEGIDPYDREVFEHWAVTDWFADKLIEAGEKVERDFAGLTVWARTTTGQAIYGDGVIEAIATELNAGVEG